MSVDKAGTGSGTITSNIDGINCGGTCSAPFSNKTPVTLTVNPEAGARFIGWSGDCSGTGPCTVTVPLETDLSVTANFESDGCSQLSIGISHTEVWPAKPGVSSAPTTSLIMAKVTSPAPAGGCEVWFEVEPIFSRGHSHGTHPKDKGGKVEPGSCIIQEGGTSCSVPVIYRSPEIAGEEKLKAMLMRGASIQESKEATVRVRVPNLILMPASGAGAWRLTGVLNSHPGSHFATPSTITRIGAMATDYFEATSGTSIGINDMSLEWGGLFDIGPPRGPFWSRPHNLHRTGRSVDIDRAGVDQTLLDKIAEKFGCRRLEVDLIHYECP